MKQHRFLRLRRRAVLALCAGLVGTLGAGPAAFAADDYPSKPVKFIVPFTPGGGTDIVTRIVAQKLSEMWGVATVVENRPGAGGIAASQFVANSAPDGYTLNVITPTQAINPSLYAKLPYDSINDFTPVALMNRLNLIIVAGPKFQANNIKELIALAKAQPNVINFASTGTGGSSHLSLELLKKEAQITMTHVPYKGSAPAYTDLMSGQVQIMNNNIISSMPLIKTGKIKAIAVTGATRSVIAPDVPAVAEDLPGFDVSSWFGIVAPAKTPKAVIAKLNRDIVKVLQMPSVRAQMLEQGAEPIEGDNSPEAFDRLIRGEEKKWADVIKSAGIRLTEGGN